MVYYITQMEKIALKRGVKIENKHKHLSNIIYRKIINGEYGDCLPGLRKLAIEYNANIKTIRKALEPLEKEGIISFKQGSGIFIIGKPHRCIGIVGRMYEEPFFKSPYFSGVFSHILPIIEGKGDFFSYQRKEEDISFTQMFKNTTSVDGLLIFAPLDRDIEQILAVKKKKPVIVVGSTYPDKDINYIDSDNFRDSFKAVSFLIKRGHKKIAFIASPIDSPTVKLRSKGYKEALKKAGIPYDLSLVITEFSDTVSFKNKIQDLYRGNNFPTAIFGANSTCTFKALEIIKEEKRELFDILEVIVYDNEEILKKFNIKGGVIIQPLAEIGKTAVKKLYELMDGSKEKVKYLFPAKIYFNGKEVRK